MTGAHFLHEGVDRLLPQEIGIVNLGAGQLSGKFASGRARRDRVHFVAAGDQARNAPTADEAARSAHHHDSARHQSAGSGLRVDGKSSKGYSASRVEMTVGVIGQRIPSAGSFHRNPAAYPGAYGTEIM